MQGLPKPAEGFMMESFSPSQMVKIDDIDKLLLYSLSKNAKITNAELSKLTAISEEAVRKRIKNLEHQKIITGYRYLVNIYNMNMETYTIFLCFDNLSPEKENALRMYIQTNPNVYYSARFIGKYNVVIGVTAKDRLQFQDILDEIRNRYSNDITLYCPP